MHEKKTLPVLLAGPILRRAEPRQVCIWVACSKPVIVKAEIYRASHLKENWVNDSNNSDAKRHNIKAAHVKPIGLGSARPVQLGRNLFVSLVIATPDGNSDSIMTHDTTQEGKVMFPTNELLAYDIEILDDSADYDLKPDSLETMGKRLEDLGLTSGKNSIVYPPFLLPTFFLHESRDGSPLKVLHGSCRKLHGKGHDCLSVADEVIGTTLKDLEQRPCALFLTGDQVYADDVAGPLIRHLTQFGIRLLGWEEQINGIGKKLTEIKVGERQQIVKQYAKFTSGSASNHLMSFGEFVAMYLVAWNVENWPASFPILEDALEDEKRKYSEQIQQLEDARKALPSVRRALANIPVYMIFDDHEITDDWNITREWHDYVQNSKCGKQIIANGLAAYWAFQGWGNDPSLFGRERMFTEDVTRYLRKKSEQTLGEDIANGTLQTAFQNHFFNIRGWGTFACPFAPMTIFLDSRTQRSYDDFNGPARLVDRQGLEFMAEMALRSGFRKTDPVLIVTPTPIFGFDLIEKLQELLAMASSVYAVDLETWSANRDGFSDLLEIVTQRLSPSHCIFLSGDVHYGFTSTGTFSLYAQEGGISEKGGNRKLLKTMNVTQFNSSALKTTSLGKEVAFGEMLGRIRQLFYQKPSVLKSRNPVGSNYGDTPAQSSTLDKKKDELFGPHTMVTRVKSKLSISRRLLTPEWITKKSFVTLSNSHVIPELIVADNNIGLVTIDTITGSISQKLLVKQDNEVQAFEAKVPLRINSS